jgi:hypothetical protein
MGSRRRMAPNTWDGRVHTYKSTEQETNQLKTTNPQNKKPISWRPQIQSTAKQRSCPQQQRKARVKPKYQTQYHQQSQQQQQRPKINEGKKIQHTRSKTQGKKTPQSS